MADTLGVVSGIREELVMAAKKMVAAVAAEGIWAVVSAATKVAVSLADNISNNGAGNGGRNRGSGGATIINHNTAAVGGSGGGTGVGGGSGGSSGLSRRWQRSWRLQRQGQILVAAAMIIDQFSLEGVRPDPRGTKLATYSNIVDIFGACGFYLHLK